MSGALLRVPQPSVFVSIGVAQKRLAQAMTLLDVKQVKDVACAMKAWARTQKDGQRAAQDAAEIVLRAERRLGELAREMPKALPPRKGTVRVADCTVIGSKASELAALGISKQRAHDYEKIAGIPREQFEESVRLAREEQREITTAGALRIAAGGKVANFSSESVEWYTPKRYIEAARQVLGGIDLDPASNAAANRVVGAKTFYSRTDDGMSKEWRGRVWLNPPYMRDVTGDWTARLAEQYCSGITHSAILLINAATERGWFRPLWDYPICFTDHRIEFYRTDDQPAASPLMGNAFVYFGTDVARFAHAFRTIGRTVIAVNSRRGKRTP